MSEIIGLNDFQRKCESLDSSSAVADFFRNQKLSKLNDDELLYLLTKILIMNANYKFDAFLDYIRDELNHRRMSNDNLKTRIISWLALGVSVVAILIKL